MPEPINIEGLSPAAAAAVIKLSRGMANSTDMESRLNFYALAKKADPTIAIPSDVQMEQFRREQKASEESKEIERQKKEAVANQEKQRKALIESGRYDEATVKKIEEEIMTPRGIADYEVAATLYAHANPEPAVTLRARGESGATWDMPWAGQTKETVSQLMQNPRKIALNKAHAVIDEIRRKRA